MIRHVFQHLQRLHKLCGVIFAVFVERPDVNAKFLEYLAVLVLNHLIGFFSAVILAELFVGFVRVLNGLLNILPSVKFFVLPLAARSWRFGDFRGCVGGFISVSKQFCDVQPSLFFAFQFRDKHTPHTFGFSNCT